DVWWDWRWATTFVLTGLTSLIWFVSTLGNFEMATWNMVATLVVGTLLIYNGIGIILPGDIRVGREVGSEDTDKSVISYISKRNTRLARLQLFLQLVIIISVL
ncbi:MAG: hypothetical protein SXQ77_06015, partial [Halobacteria archaeon]|nr:hypothetical protein [Halobacteria archaeon]